MRLLARAKINWVLSVLGKQPSGYHELDMLVQSVALSDTLDIEKADGIALSLRRQRRVPADDHNIVLQAANALKKIYHVNEGAHIVLTKRIPIGAGLGGGSADAAATLIGLNRLWNLHLTNEELAETALGIGADVPFCLIGGVARVGGIGERIEPLTCGKPLRVLIVQPCKGLSTPTIFNAYDSLDPVPQNPLPLRGQEAIQKGDLPALAAAMGNALLGAALPLRPEIAVCIQAMEHYGALRAEMTGSGSAVIGLFDREKTLSRAFRACMRIWPRTSATHTVPEGVSFL